MAADPFKNRVRLRCCALVISDSRLLLVKQRVPTRNDAIWLPPGGELQLGETAKKAAQREVSEETGLQVNIRELAAIHEFIEPPYHAIELYFFADPEGGELATGTDPELRDSEQQIIETGFIKLSELSRLAVYPEFIKKSIGLMISGNRPLPVHVISSPGLSRN